MRTSKNSGFKACEKLKSEGYQLLPFEKNKREAVDADSYSSGIMGKQKV